MKTKPHPTRTTIVYGLICALALAPLSIVFGSLLSWATGFRLILWLYLAVYALLLARWSGQLTLGIVFPLLLLLIAAIWIKPLTAYGLFCLGILSWIRSGVCFEDWRAGRFTAELILCLGGGMMIAGFNPHSTISWALGILMFFLLQAVYFVFFGVDEHSRCSVDKIDSFELARSAAEKSFRRAISECLLSLIEPFFIWGMNSANGSSRFSKRLIETNRVLL